MMWPHKDCPLCGEELEAVHSDPSEPVYTLRCPTKVDAPLKVLMKLESSYALDSLQSHFEVDIQNQKLFYQTVRVYPFIVESYDDTSNIYKYDEDMNRRFVVETDFINLPWGDQAKIRQKLSTYVNFS